MALPGGVLLGTSEMEAIKTLPLIGGLFLHGCPSAIIRRVGTVVVDALKRMFRRGFWSHIGEEVSEGVSPTVADVDTSRAIVAVKLTGFDVTTVITAVPRYIFRRATSAMRDESNLGLVKHETAAAFRVPILQRISSYWKQFAALTTAHPSKMFALVIVIIQRGQSSEPLTGQVFRFRPSLAHLTILQENA